MYIRNSRITPLIVATVFLSFSTFCVAGNLPPKGLFVEVKHKKSKDMTVGNTARPGDVAIKQEYDAAVTANSEKALALFIARHPNSKWTADAQKRLIKVQGK